MQSRLQVIYRWSRRLCNQLTAGAILLCGLVGGGCASVESTMVTRDETNQIWERHNCLNGIPITLKVPTHLKVYVFHKHYLEVVTNAAGQTTDVKPVDLDVVVRDFAHELMWTDKVFVVDFKRPVAGSANLKVKMTDQQYIDEIQHDITDETISQIASLFGNLVGSAGLRLNATPVAGETTPNTVEIKSLVAVGIFEIESPDFEHQVRQFMNCHVNKAHDAWVVPPDVNTINRVGISPADNLQTPYPELPLCPRNSHCPGTMQPFGSDPATPLEIVAPGSESAGAPIRLPVASAGVLLSLSYRTVSNLRRLPSAT